MTAQEMIAVITAHAEGKTIEGRTKGGGEWIKVIHVQRQGFDFINWEYRIKPEPREPRTRFINEYKSGLHVTAHWTVEEAAAAASRNTDLGHVAIRKFIEVIE